MQHWDIVKRVAMKSSHDGAKYICVIEVNPGREIVARFVADHVKRPVKDSR